jgi:hypothetical protein
MSSYLYSFRALVFAFAFFLYGHESLDRLVTYSLMLPLSSSLPHLRLHLHHAHVLSHAFSPSLPISSHRYVIVHISCDLFRCASCSTVLFITIFDIALILSHDYSSFLSPNLLRLVKQSLTVEFFLFFYCRMRNPTPCLPLFPPPSLLGEQAAAPNKASSLVAFLQCGIAGAFAVL